MKFRLIGVLILLGLSPLEARVITLQPQVRAVIRGRFLEASISITNDGDEAANAVQVQAEALGIVQQSSTKPTLDPREQFTTALRFPLQAPLPGRYPLVLRIFYTDTNGYAFSALALTPFFVKKDVRPGLWGTLGRTAMDREGTTSLRMKEMGNEARQIHVRVLMPRELSADPEAFDQTLLAGGETRLPLTLRNISALVGSTYPIYALLEYDAAGLHHLAVAPGLVQINPQGSASTLYKDPLAIAFLLVLAVIVWINMHAARRRRETKSPAASRSKLKRG